MHSTEAKAAKSADLKVIVLERPGNAPLTEADRVEFTVATTFADISLDVVPTGAVKRKLADEENVAEPEVN